MRIDLFLYENHVFPSRNKAQEGIKEGLVLYKGKPCKASLEVDSFDDLEILKKDVSFVSNGGYKLEKAISDFNFDPLGLEFVDVGASNGGFTDCLLRHGAKKVYALDVGESQLEDVLKTDPRVTVVDNYNARDLNVSVFNGVQIDGGTCDVSFISLKYVLEPIYSVLKDKGVLISLIKPQFECGRSALDKNGIVKDKKDHINCVTSLYTFCRSIGFGVCGFTNAPIKEKKNVEYLFLLKKGEASSVSLIDIVNFINKEVKLK